MNNQEIVNRLYSYDEYELYMDGGALLKEAADMIEKLTERAESAERERDEISKLLSQANKVIGRIQNFTVYKELRFDPFYENYMPIAEEAKKAICQELTSKMDKFIEYKVYNGPGYATDIVRATLSLLRREREE